MTKTTWGEGQPTDDTAALVMSMRAGQAEEDRVIADMNAHFARLNVVAEQLLKDERKARRDEQMVSSLGALTICSRRHEQDLPGEVMSVGSWEHLTLPAFAPLPPGPDLLERVKFYELLRANSQHYVLVNGVCDATSWLPEHPPSDPEE